MAIGGVVDGCPAGVLLDVQAVQAELDRRRPGQSAYTTERKEDDQVEWLSGLFEGKTTGAPIAFIIRNKDQRSGDYDAMRDVYRPGHADFTYEAKYGLRDHRGSGRASARETACRVVGGAIARQLLAAQGIEVLAYVSSVKDLHAALTPEQVNRVLVEASPVRCPDATTSSRIEQLILKAKEAGDSLGGIVTCICKGVPAGWGEPVFDKLNARLAAAMLSINAVKGFEMGDGFSATLRYGSQNNDGFGEASSNHDGGVQGGISNGKSIWFRTAFKPTSTIAKAQSTLNTAGEEVTLEAKGRHDPCVLPRAVPIVEAMAALVLCDAWLQSKSNRI